MYAELRDSRTGARAPFRTGLNFERAADGLRFSFECENSKRFSAYEDDNEPIYNGDVVEVFVCVGEDKSRYFEVEVAPNGAVFFAKIVNDGEGISAEMLEKNFVSSARATENGYDAEIFLPNEAIGLKEGDSVFFNAYRIETDGGEPEKYLLALNPTLCGSFHKPSFFVALEEV